MATKVSGPYNCNSSYNSSAESGSAINRIGRVTGPNTGRPGYSCSTGCCVGASWMTHSGYMPCQSGDTPVATHHAVINIDKDNVHGFGGIMSVPTSKARVGRISTSGIHGCHPDCITKTNNGLATGHNCCDKTDYNTGGNTSYSTCHSASHDTGCSTAHNCNSTYNSRHNADSSDGCNANRIGRVTGPNTGRPGYSCSTGCCAGAGWMTHSGYVPCQSGDTPVVINIDKDNVHGFGGMMCLPTSRARVGRISTSGINGCHPDCINPCCSSTLRL